MKYLFQILINLFSICFLISCQFDSKNDLENEKIWFDTPAKVWEEALPLGNGRLGVMVFGDPKNERIQLNDDSLWPNDLEWDEPKGTPEDLNKIRTLLLNGESKLADSLLVEKFSNKTVIRSHQTLGDLFLKWDHNKISDYSRSLELNSAICKTSFKSEGYPINQKVFVSNPNQVIVVNIESAHPDGLNGIIKLNRPKDNGFETVKILSANNQIIMSGEITQKDGEFRSIKAPILNGVKFQTNLIASNIGGEIEPKNNELKVNNVKKLILYIVSNSNYYYKDFVSKNKKDLLNINNSSFEEIENFHFKDYQSLFKRVRLKINSDRNLESLTTSERLSRIKLGKIDNGLTKLLFDYGRYLLISSSRPKTLPANLQGIWNQHIKAPWNADYHLNINLQMNYWLANVTNLPELNFPFFDFVDRLIENGKITARKNFGMEGSFIPHATDLWAPTWLRAPTAYWGGSFGAGGWLMQHYWQHYEFTNDIDFLKNRAFPAIEQVVKFYNDWLIVDPRDQKLISTPSTSPENRYLNEHGEPVATCLGSAMDQQIIYEIFANYLKASEILNINTKLTSLIKFKIKELRDGFIIGKDGRILEWDKDYKEYEPGHRHMSHLYGFHPGTQITIRDQPRLFNAVRETLNHRLINGGAGTGWSRAWLINYAARLLDGEMALNHIQLLFKKSMYENLFDAHPPFQIDGNFGFTAGIAEMLIQSHEKSGIRILPAIPKAWKSGSVKGLIARGNVKVDLIWKNNKLIQATLLSNENKSTSIIYNNKIFKINLRADVPYYFNN
ncbi:MAG: glycoside hydrolase family 95 protein [Flavobacteriaceae bacterium]|nr:glycoside hydrolase family 95 protein [Flavobacteriaceae bacterium]